MKGQFKPGYSIVVLAAAVFSAAPSLAQDRDLSAQYTWAPVEIGAGGWIRGMAISPSDPTHMYARGDVENLYRWNAAAQTWVPTKLASAFPASLTAVPAQAGAGAIAIDAQNPNHLLAAYQFAVSTDLAATNPSFHLNVYASWDGGVTFSAGNLSLSGNLSSQTSGERLAFDPNNGNVAYFGSPGAQGTADGLYRTADGGLTWTQVSGGGYPANTPTVRYESQLPRFDGGNGTVKGNGQTVSGTLYITYIEHDETNSDAVSGGGVLQSADGGQTWTDATDPAASNICSSGQPQSQLCWATVDSAGNLWVTDGNASGNLFKRSRSGAWSTLATPKGGAGGIAVDPANPNRIFIDAGDVLQRSLDGGQSWVTLGNSYTWSSAQSIPWLDPSPFRPVGYYVSESGLYFDTLGNLWQPCGNDGIVTTTPNDATDTPSHPPTWTSMARGIEEMVASAAAIPPGGIPVLGVADESEFSIPNPDTYTAQHYPISTWVNGGYGLGMSQDVAYAPNAPNFIVVPDANDETSQGTQPQFQYAGYSNDGGNTWSVFPSVASGTHPCVLYGGEIAVSARPSNQQAEAPGSDDIVWFPTNAGDPGAAYGQVPAPFYSTDGGATWTQTKAFNGIAGASAFAECSSNASYTFLPAQMGDWLYVLSQHQLVADPSIPGTFYLKTTYGNSSGGDGGFWKSTDGGVTWAETAGTAQVPNYTSWGRMAANPNASGDLWLVDGWQGATSHGLFHTVDGGASFLRNPAFTYAWQLALGKAASGQAYPAIYIYGLPASDSKWGVFQSVDGGKNFNRISYYPYGIFDVPFVMAASWDVFGTVYVGFSGNSFYYAQYNANDPKAPSPTFSPAAGTYTAAQQVAIAAAGPNTAIYYTTDGSAPTANSNLYGGPITVSSGSETISALATASGFAPGPVASGTFVIAPPAPAPAPSFAIGIAPAALTLQPGGQGTVSVTLTPVNGFNATVAFTCSGLPQGAACSFNPSQLTPSGAPLAMQLTITAGQTAGALKPQSAPFLPLAALAATVFLFGWKRNALSKAALLACLVFAPIYGCGKGQSSTSQPSPPIQATVTVIATSGSLLQKGTLALTIY